MIRGFIWDIISLSLFLLMCFFGGPKCYASPDVGDSKIPALLGLFCCCSAGPLFASLGFLDSGSESGVKP